jgi:hypothetical protein
MEDMQISINEKEAEIIRLNMCLGDERIKKCEIVRNNENTPSKNTKSLSASGSAIRGMGDSPHFYKGT